MTNEEVLKMLKAKRECILKEIDPSSGCDDEKCDGCDLNYEQGRMGEQAEALHIAIESLEAWEKIKEEIKGIDENPDYKPIGTYDYVRGSEDCRKVVLEIINKHLSEV